jgi:hypothetical protein
MDEDGQEDQERRRIPPQLLTRLLHEFFEKEDTRITRDANDAAAKYMDTFVREAIARSVRESGSRNFIDVSIPQSLISCRRSFSG